jgi:hypothetical protein
MSVPNQLVIQEFNYEPCDKSNLYATINLEAMKYAIQTFSAINSLRLWMYLSKNNKGFKHLELSSKDCISWGLGKTQFSKAKDDLIAKGFLVHRGGNVYDFIQNPDSGQNGSETEQNLIEIPETEQFSSETELLESVMASLEQDEPVSELKTKNSGNRTKNDIDENAGIFPDSELSSPVLSKNWTESGREILQYNTDNTINDNDWEECRGYTFVQMMNLTDDYEVVEETDEWIYVLTNGGRNKIKFKKNVDWSGMF